MTTETITNPAQQYLQAVHKGLSDLPEDDIEEVLQDLAAHIAELGETDPEAALGAPETFVSEFRHSAGLDSGDTGRRQRRIVRWVRRRLGTLEQSRRRMTRTFQPLLAPLSRHRAELRTIWIWLRGILALSAYAWVSGDGYGNQSWLGFGGVVPTVMVMGVATAASVWLAGQRGKWWRRIGIATSVAAALVVLVALTTSRYQTYPDQTFYGEPEDTAPVLLIGPNGPIQNLYAYDTSGNPVQVLLYDEYGNPILTLPSYAYDEAGTDSRTGDPFVWEGYELRFATDTYGRPIGNLYPLARYEWTETGARSAPQPPPVVGIPEIPIAGTTSDEQTDPGTTTITTTPTTAEPGLPGRY